MLNFCPISPGEITDDDREKVVKLKDLIDHGYYAIKQPDGIVIEQMPNSREVLKGFAQRTLLKAAMLAW